MARVLCFALVVAAAVTGCKSIEGTRDLSTTLQSDLGGAITDIAVAPVAKASGAPGLADRLESGLVNALNAALPRTSILTAQEVGVHLSSQEGALEIFANWKSVYDETGMVEQGLLREFSGALDVRYLLVVQSVDLRRTKVRAVDLERVGWVSDANNVWQSKLRFGAELIDTRTAEIVWRGQGEAENINSPRKDVDLGLIIHQQKNPGLDTFLPEMIRIATTGIASELAEAQRALDKLPPSDRAGTMDRRETLPAQGGEERNSPPAAPAPAGASDRRAPRSEIERDLRRMCNEANQGNEVAAQACYEHRLREHRALNAD